VPAADGSADGHAEEAEEAPKPKGKASDGDNATCGKPGHPVRAVTGACTNTFVEFVSGGFFEWKRDYSSDRGPGPLGYGSRESYQRSLSVWLHRAVLTNWDGEEIVFPRFERGSHVTRAKGYVLTRVDATTALPSQTHQSVVWLCGPRDRGKFSPA